MDYTEYFEPLEKARETGAGAEALRLSQIALLDAGMQNDPVLAINAYGHQLLVFKDEHARTGNVFYLHCMHSLVIAGIALAKDLGVTGQPVAVMHLRLGDYFFQCGKFAEAVGELEQALAITKAVEQEKPGEYAEYLSHLGKAKVYAGDASGVVQLEQAVEKTAGVTELREFHHMTVHSGNMLRLMAAEVVLGHTDRARGILNEIVPIARSLEVEYGMPMRMEQVRKAAAQLGVELPE